MQQESVTWKPSLDYSVFTTSAMRAAILPCDRYLQIFRMAVWALVRRCGGALNCWDSAQDLVEPKSFIENDQGTGMAE